MAAAPAVEGLLEALAAFVRTALPLFGILALPTVAVWLWWTVYSSEPTRTVDESEVRSPIADRHRPVRELLREVPVRSVADLDASDRGGPVAVSGTVAVADAEPATFRSPAGRRRNAVLAGYAVDREVESAVTGTRTERAYAGVMATPFRLTADGASVRVGPGNHLNRFDGTVVEESLLPDSVEIAEVVVRFDRFRTVDRRDPGESPPGHLQELLGFSHRMRPPGNPGIEVREGVVRPGDEAVVLGYLDPGADDGGRHDGGRRRAGRDGARSGADRVAPPTDGGPLFVSTRSAAVEGAGDGPGPAFDAGPEFPGTDGEGSPGDRW